MTVKPLVSLGNLLPIPLQQFFDANGVPLGAGSVYTYAADGVTPKATYKEAAQLTLHPNPIILDAAGRPQGPAGIYGTGNYVFGVFDAFGVLQYTQPTADTTTSLSVSSLGEQLIQQTTTADMQTLLGITTAVLPFGTPLPYAGPTAPSGWVFCFGQAISRSLNPNLFAAITTTWGPGDGSTTFNLPDLRGRIWAGADDMGGTPANRLTSASIGESAVLGVSGGDELLQGHTHVADVTETGHTHPQFYVANFPGSGTPEGNVTNAVGPGLQSPDVVTGEATTGLTVAIESSGGGAAQNVQPLSVGNWIMQLG